ncbi:flavodoxin [Romboutsia maritimum]|uniref:Flavodoxin n=1 Tax=Romboutsia maritimum TaxID=2020948 RepID=A0A371IS81_9FIRM|nr:flavodoxin [Romboutsia maritimum]RDY23350.1 flavodoxin [Romboutsia maritimum]
MNKINIIYWSGSGNTETMAESVYSTCKDNAHSKLLSVDKASIENINEADILFLGCPSMGDEQLEESEMEPFMETISSSIKDKKIILFGSYGWGDGQWMKDWEERIKSLGGILIEDSIISNYEPSESETDLLKSLGKKYA